VLDALCDCGAVSGGSAVFGGHGTRSAESPVIDLRHGGVVRFSLKYGSTGDDACEAVEEGEGVEVEYLDAASSMWISLEVPELNDIRRFSSFSEVTIKVPEGAWMMSRLSRTHRVAEVWTMLTFSSCV
jgi:hypothetical protein